MRTGVEVEFTLVNLTQYLKMLFCKIARKLIVNNETYYFTYLVKKNLAGIMFECWKFRTENLPVKKSISESPRMGIIVLN